MSYKNLSEEAREGLSAGNNLRKKNLIADYPFFLAKRFFRWVANDLYLVIYGMMVALVLLGLVGVYFDWLKL